MEAFELADGEFPIRRFAVRGANPWSALNADIPRFGDMHPANPSWRVSNVRTSPLSKDAAVVDVTYSLPVADLPKSMTVDELRDRLKDWQAYSDADRARFIDQLKRVRVTKDGRPIDVEINDMREAKPLPTPPPAPIDDLPLWTSRTLEWIGPHPKAGDWTRGSPEPTGPREYKTYTLRPAFPWSWAMFWVALVAAAVYGSVRTDGTLQILCGLVAGAVVASAFILFVTWWTLEVEPPVSGGPR